MIELLNELLLFNSTTLSDPPLWPLWPVTLLVGVVILRRRIRP
jgi:hypothetical protein